MAIVTSSDISVGPGSRWQEQLKSAIRDPAELCRQLELPTSFARSAQDGAASFPVFAPLPFVDKIKPGDVGDPLLRQILPLAAEQTHVSGDSQDPVGDLHAELTPGLLQKYAGRALMVTTGACAVHCRYCFRRHFPYEESPPSMKSWQTAIDRLARDTTIEEVLLSGGDPLMLVDDQLQELVARLDAIDHLRRLRIHTRLPTMIPQRITNALLALLQRTRLTPVVVIHVNHAQEIGDDVFEACRNLVNAGIPLLNQTVLLRGVNDDEDVLAELCGRLIEMRVMPYYLHQLDRVSGAAHFEVPIARGLWLVQALRERLPGYAVPRYVQEVAGESAKRLLA